MVILILSMLGPEIRILAKILLQVIIHPSKLYRLFRSQQLYDSFPKILFTQTTINGLTNNKTKNALHNETVILNYIGGDPNNHNLRNSPFVNVL